MEIPKGYVGLICARSGLDCISFANKVGVINSDYRGEIFVTLHNHSSDEVMIEPDSKIGQIIITPYMNEKFKENFVRIVLQDE